jgi:hypothetical protein
LKTAARKMYSTHKMPRLIATDESDFIWKPKLPLCLTKYHITKTLSCA